MNAPRVLIVDDSRLTRTLIRNALVSAGYVIAGEAVNGREGIEQTARLKPDLVTVDITMPEKGGLESIGEILAAHPGAKGLMVTALGTQKLLQEDARKLGAGMIAKPFHPAEIVRTADRLLGRRSAAARGHLAVPQSVSLNGSGKGKLTSAQLADLMEIGNIGAGNAASKLSEVLESRCLISVPQVAFLTAEDITSVYAADDWFLASLGLKVLGDIPAVMLVALERSRIPDALKKLLGEGWTDPAAAVPWALGRAGKFMTQAFTQAVNQLLASRAKAPVPEVSVATDAGELKALLEGGGSGPHLLIHCDFSDGEGTFDGKLAYVLSPSSQRTVLARLQAILGTPTAPRRKKPKK